jgi:choice-of-anchor B domain-containing protein
MKKISLCLSAILLCVSMWSQTPCANGMAGIYPCGGIDLLSHLSDSQLGGGVNGNTVWGWTDPETGHEIAIYGLSNGAAFIDITDPVNPIYIGLLPMHTTPSLWRELKVYDHYVCIVSEADEHGLQIFDLNQVVGIANPPVEFTESAYYGAFGQAHNIAINPETPFAYCMGANNTYGGGLHIVDIQDPLNPVLAGGFDGVGYIHDCQPVIYSGPDAQYIGQEIVFAYHGDGMAVVNCTDKTDCILLSDTQYPQTGYTHQGWLTEDQRYVLMDDETDEVSFGQNTRTHIFDAQDLENVLYMGYFEGPLNSSDHNLYIKGNYAYLSNYKSGLRIYNIENIANAELSEVAFFDVYPNNNESGYDGSWNNYPYFASGNIPVSTIHQGFFVVRPNWDLISSAKEIQSKFIEYNISPNPASDHFKITLNGELLQSVVISDMTGKTVASYPDMPVAHAFVVDSSKLTPGVYFISINGKFNSRITIE